MKNPKRGDLVEYDFALGLVLEVDVRDNRFAGGEFIVCKVLFTDGPHWVNAKVLHEPGPFLRLKASGDGHSWKGSGA